MNLNPPSALETKLASGLLYRWLHGPLESLTFELACAKDSQQKLLIIKKLIEKHLPADKSGAAVDLQDSLIQNLFDQAMENMVRMEIKKAHEHSQRMVNFTYRCILSLAMLEDLKPKTWKDYAQQGFDKVNQVVTKTINRSPMLKAGIGAMQKGLSKVGIVAKEQEPIDPELILIAEEDDWHEVDTPDSYNARVAAILSKWEKNPSLVLETEPTKHNMNYIKTKILPLAKAISP